MIESQMLKQDLRSLDWQSNSLQKQIKGRGGRRFLSNIPLPENSLFANFYNTAHKPLSNSLEFSKSLTSETLKTPLIINLDKSEGHHATSVLRLKNNDLVSVFDKDKQIEGLGILHYDKGKTPDVLVELHYLQKTTTPLPSLLIGLPKPKTAELIVEKACEIGCENIIFFTSEHSVSRDISDKNINSKLDRLSLIRDSAIKQSYTYHAPKIHFYVNLNSFISNIGSFSFDKFYFCEPSLYLEENTLLNKDSLTQLPIHDAVKSSDLNYKKPLICIGPEGGFSNKEQETFLNNNFHLLSLGINILKVDTAAIYSLSVFGARFLNA